MHYWSQWSCGKSRAGALAVLQLWHLQLNICSTVLWPAPKLASPCLGGLSTLWSCSPDIVWGFPSLQVIWSTPLATSSVPRSFDIELLVLSLFLPPHYLSVQRGMSSIPGNLPVFTAASTSLSVPADCPLFQWRTGWLVVWSRRCRVHCCNCHRSILPTSSAFHPCRW